MTPPQNSIYAGYRYPAELISHAVWLYFRFPLSLRMVEEMLAARGISVTYETVRQWGLKFGRELANRIRRRAPAAATNGTSMRSSSPSLGRSIGSGALSTKRQKAAKRPFRKLLKEQGRAPRVLITDKLKSAIRPPSAKSCLASSTGSTKTSITERRIPTNRRDDESGS
jgi:putative transposase